MLVARPFVLLSQTRQPELSAGTTFFVFVLPLSFTKEGLFRS